MVGNTLRGCNFAEDVLCGDYITIHDSLNDLVAGDRTDRLSSDRHHNRPDRL